MDSRRPSSHNWRIQWRIYTLEWLDIQLRDDFTSKPAFVLLTPLLGSRVSDPLHEMVPQRRMAAHCWPFGLREVLAGQHEQRGDVPGPQRADSRRQVRWLSSSAAFVFWMCFFHRFIEPQTDNTFDRLQLSKFKYKFWYRRPNKALDSVHSLCPLMGSSVVGTGRVAFCLKWRWISTATVDMLLVIGKSGSF